MTVEVAPLADDLFSRVIILETTFVLSKSCHLTGLTVHDLLETVVR